MDRQVILKETHLEVMCRFQHLTILLRKSWKGLSSTMLLLPLRMTKKSQLFLNLTQKTPQLLLLMKYS